MSIDGVVSSGTLLERPSDSSMDFTYMDELFLDGCWLETTTDASGFLLQSPSSCNPHLDHSFSWPALEVEERQSPLFNEFQETQERINNTGEVCNQSENHSDENSEVVTTRWWIGPMANHLNPQLSVLERLIKALVYIRDFNKDKDMLIQIWVPINNKAGRKILTTSDLPFSLETRCPNLAKYREISEKYQFSAEEDCKALVAGLPGRVFIDKVPEWTPDVRFFRSDEYPRVDHAQEYDVRGTLALPVFERGSRTCLGVIEVVMTTQKIKYFSELESVCKALEVFLLAYFYIRLCLCINMMIFVPLL